MDTAPTGGPLPVGVDAFRHEAFLYADADELLAGLVPFVRDGLAADERILVVLGAAKLDLLRSALGDDAREVAFADMAVMGHNPARIIPAWQDFVARNAPSGRGLRGVGEPIWPGRRPAELAECLRHESLLNLAFGDGPPWWLLCPYDRRALDPAMLHEAHRNHPHVLAGGAHRPSPHFAASGAAAGRLDDPLPEPPVPPSTLAFEEGPLLPVRRFVARHATAAGLDARRTSDLVVAVNEVATNSILHGGGGGTLRLWQDGDAVVCEVRDRGRFDQPLVDRRRPTTDQMGGRGLWAANQLCDLVQIRSSAGGTVVRLHVLRG